MNNIYCDEKRQECCRRRRGNSFGKYNYFLPRREDVTSRSSDCLADKRFVSSRKWFAFSIVVDHFSLTDVILFVILKIVLCGITYAHPGLWPLRDLCIYRSMRFLLATRSSFCFWSSEFEIIFGASKLFKKFSLAATYLRWNFYFWLGKFKCKNILTSLSIDAISRTSFAYSSSLALYNWS